jgi:putative Mn2+ efflux pump MntP
MMTFPALVILALGLAMDATAVAGARGLAAKRVRTRDAVLVALLFGGFQAGMPALGWALGEAFATRIMGWGHWVTFVVLGGIGGKMLYEALKPGDDDEAERERASQPGASDVFGLKVLVLLAIATSIDALAAGVALAVANVSVVSACTVIGVVTALLSFAGVHAGHRFGSRLGKRLEVLGGVVLIGLAVKTLVEHFYGR